MTPDPASLDLSSYFESETAISDARLRLPIMEIEPSQRPELATPGRVQYRALPVSVAVDPISLVISECISITSEIRKRVPSSHSSVSAILGGNPNTVQLGQPSPGPKSGNQHPEDNMVEDIQELGLTNRWGLRGRKGAVARDNPLISSFGKLRYELSGVKDVRTFDAPSLLQPFLQILQTKGTAAPITILALSALRKFLAYGFICPDSPRFPLAMQSLSSALTHCQFSDSGQMEVVLLMILNLMEDMLSGPGGDILSDESICDMMGRGLAICSQTRFSPVLRQTAEASMVRMCQIIFEAVKHLDAQTAHGTELRSKTNGESSSVVISTTEATIEDLPVGIEPRQPSDRTSANTPRSSTGSSNSSSNASDAGSEANSQDQSVEPPRSTSPDLQPYSLPSIGELFRVLVSFLDPNDRQQTDTMRIMALRIIHVALEVAGPFLVKYTALGHITEDGLCRYLFQLVRSDNLDLLQESLAVASTLLATCRGALKLQQELFLSYLVACLHPALEIPKEPGIDPSLYAGIPQTPKLVKAPASQNGSGRSTPVQIKDRQKLGLEGGARKPDARQAMVECISVLLRMPSYMVELFVNYDCDEDRVDLCEDMIGLLARNALPDSATWSTTSVPPLCLDALLRYIQFLAERLDWRSTESNLPDAGLLRMRRSKKKVIIKGANKFNENPKSGLGYLEAHGIIDNIRDPLSVAKFLKRTQRISKKILGEFLSKKGNEPILEAFLDLFDFSGKRVDEALRVLLETFRLPGESALIERILSSFSEKYCANSTPVEVADKDAVYVLTYAIIMLNTDQHSPQLKSSKRMSLEDFSRNLRGVNAGENFSPEYLSDIFNSIKSNEIILPDEHDNQHAFDYAWRELLSKADTAGPVIRCDTNIYDADLFASTWKPVVSTLSYVFMSATDDTVFARVVTGFDECARIAARYGLVDALDQIVHSLSYMTTIATSVPFNTGLNTEVQAGDNSVMVSELAVKLGRDFRAQLATLVLFRVVSGNEHIIKDGWKYILRIWLNLFLNSLIPPFFSENQNELGIPIIPLQPPSQVIDRASRPSEGGFFSAFTSYISSYAADDPPEPSHEELESTLCTVDCINQCRMGDIFARISTFSASEVAHLIDALLHELPEDHGSAVISVKAPSAVPGSPDEGRSQDTQPRYNPGFIYLLEFCTVLTLRSEDSVGTFGEKLAGTLFGVLRNVTAHHAVAVARTAFYLLKLLHSSYDHGFVNVPILLHTLSNLPDAVVTPSAPLILQGICICIEEPGPLRSEIMTSPDFWVLLRNLALRKDTSEIVFAILERGTAGSPPAIMADNYEAAISLLSDFASASRMAVNGKSSTVPKGNKDPTNTQARGSVSSKDAAITRGTKAISIIYNMTDRIPYLMKHSHLESSEAWAAYWLPIFNALTAQCTNSCREVRNIALTSLQRTLLSPELTCNDHKEWTAIFTEVLFPLILNLLRPEVFLSDRDGMSEMRVQVASLLCKVFLQYLVLLSAWDGMLDLWIKIVDILDRLMNSGQGDSLEEAVRENLKNVILFMATSKYLVSPTIDPSKEKLWTETWKRIDRFLPELKSELALDEPDEEVEKGAATQGN
ncbi:hypothetical protein jhhlp_003360 [Lomentospora prolificans]|uniref:SEC7 domain-containing protein n=1 Tax=Lomentospora prolificans TaxID=41688 RepID=A0A2N3NGP3_9PEZI|nr:hypothetical protein jhhlp_003360 [Lomentospora prolificans]